MTTKTYSEEQMRTRWREISPDVRLTEEEGAPRSRSWESTIHNADITVEKSRDQTTRGEVLSASTANVKKQYAEEQILGWWQGRVVSVSSHTFEADLCDLDGKESLALFDKKAAGKTQQGEIREGARFVYYVTRSENIDGTKTTSSVEFLPSYIYQEGDADFIKRRLRELYEE